MNRMFQKRCQELRVNLLPLEVLSSGWKRWLLCKSRLGSALFAEGSQDMQHCCGRFCCLVLLSFARRKLSCLDYSPMSMLAEGLPQLLGRQGEDSGTTADPWGRAARCPMVRCQDAWSARRNSM